MDNNSTYRFTNKSGTGFINPYTFIPFDRKKTDRRPGTVLKETEERLSGAIRCEITLKTPLIIPDAEEKIEVLLQSGKKHYRYPFMKDIDGHLMIPGSSIRGPVRSFYETLTGSCFPTIRKLTTEDGSFTGEQISARWSEPRDVKPGLLEYEDGKLTLYEAERYLVKTKETKAHGRCYTREELTNIGYGAPVVFSFESLKNRKIVTEIFDHRAPQTGIDIKDGFLVVGEPIESKKYESIFVKKEQKNYKSAILENAVDNLEYVLATYQDDSIHPDDYNLEAYSHVPLKKFRETQSGTLPVWYRESGGRIYFSLAQIGRFVYWNTVNDLIETKDSCIDRSRLCKACELFGMIGRGSTENLGMGSKVRFTDAVFSGSQRSLDYVTLKNLGTPRISYLPFYGKLQNSKVIYDYDHSLSEIAGRKYYWHFSPVDYKAEAETPSNQTMEILSVSQKAKEPVGTFMFTVYYDGITDQQRKELLWTLCMGENDPEGERCYKIGHGKPLGFGSVKISILSVEERRFDGENYVIKKTERGEQLSELLSEKPFKAIPEEDILERVIRFDPQFGKSVKVKYPEVVAAPGIKAIKDNDLASHQWFGNNRQLGRDNAQYALPVPSPGADLVLPSLEYLGAGDKKNNHPKGPIEIVQPDQWKEKPKKFPRLKTLVLICGNQDAIKENELEAAKQWLEERGGAAVDITKIEGEASIEYLSRFAGEYQSLILPDRNKRNQPIIKDEKLKKQVRDMFAYVQILNSNEYARKTDPWAQFS